MRRAPLRTREPVECALPMATFIAAVAIRGRRPVDGKRTCARARCSCGSRVSRPCPSVPTLIDSGCLMVSRARLSGTRRGQWRRRTAAHAVMPLPDPGSARRAARASGSGAQPAASNPKKAFASEMSAGAASARVLQWPHRRLANRRPRTQISRCGVPGNTVNLSDRNLRSDALKPLGGSAE